VQYFEIYGNRAIYKDGWWAACMLDRLPWDATPSTIARFAPGTYDPEQDVWELYYLPDDFSQANNIAAEHPEKLTELKELFWQEAEKNKVLPLLGGFSVFFGILPPLPTITRYTFYGDTENIASGMIPRVYGRSYAIEASLHVPASGAEGVIVAEADEMGGFSIWIDEHAHLRHSYSAMGVQQYKHSSSEPIPTGDITIRVLFEADEAKPGTGGTISLYADEKKIGEDRMQSTVPGRFSGYSGMDIGRDNGLPVDREYRDRSPYPFTGTVKTLVFDLKPHPHEHEQALHETAAHGATAHGISA
jgi:arylsulfatase